LESYDVILIVNPLMDKVRIVSVHALRWDQFRELSEQGEEPQKSFWRKWHQAAKVAELSAEPGPEPIKASTDKKDGQLPHVDDGTLQPGDDTTAIRNPPVQPCDMAFFSVFDGHAGAAMADVLEEAAHALLVLSMANDEMAAEGDENTIVQIMKDVSVLCIASAK
jgi:hypothetical protein